MGTMVGIYTYVDKLDKLVVNFKDFPPPLIPDANHDTHGQCFYLDRVVVSVEGSCCT